MNSKLCKKLRREAVFINDKPTIYTEKYVLKEITIINKKGEKELVVVKKFITILGDCTRKAYKSLKEDYA